MIFGVIGHVDHGKTALVRALTGMETDRLREEQMRGVSIALGFAHAEVERTEIDFIDMPGHERFVRTMVAGATGMQGALLVVAANEGVKPQTREHVDIVALLGVRRAVIAVTKADLVSADVAEAAGREATALLTRVGLPTLPPILTSTVTGQGLDDLRAGLADAARANEKLGDDGFVFLPVDRAFSLMGHGTVVTGTLRRGRLARGDALELPPSGRLVRVRSLQVHGRIVESAPPGQRVAANLRGVEVDEVPRGTALASPGSIDRSEWMTVEVTAAQNAPELANGARLNLLIGTSETPARLRLLDRDVMGAGETGLAQLRCAQPVATPARERFILRLPSPAATIAGGRVIEPAAQRRRRFDAQALAYLSRLSRADSTETLALAVEQVSETGAPLAELARLAGISPALAAARLKFLPAERTRTDVVVSRAAFDRVVAKALVVLDEARGVALPVNRLRERLGEAGVVLDEVIARLTASGKVRTEGGAVRLVRADQERLRRESETALAARLAETLRRGGLTPPDVSGAAAPSEVKRALDRLVRESLVVRTWDRVQKREIIFHREAVETARRILAPRLATDGLLVNEAGALLGASRKYSVPLLEHLDAVQFSRRSGDRRVLGPAARS